MSISKGTHVLRSVAGGRRTRSPQTATRLLEAWGSGDPGARDALLPIVYEELRRRAAGCLRRERRDHTLQPTALVHEAYIRLVGQQHASWRSRAHFLAVAAQMMRRILIDYARLRHAAKRPDNALRVVVDMERIEAVQPLDCELLLLDDALTELSAIDERQGRIIELRYFGGLTEDEVAELLSVSRSTVTREWHMARAWLYRRMTAGRPEVSP